MKQKRQPDRLKIGIPTTLFAAYHLAYWVKFITLSGMEVVLSSESTEKTAYLGSRLMPHEFCIPIKLLIGHVQELREQDDVDAILIPRMISRGNSNFSCPKLIGLPEIVQNTIGLETAKFFTPYVSCNGLDIKMLEFPKANYGLLKRMKVAEAKANQAWQSTLAQCRSHQLTLPEAIAGRNEPSAVLPLKIGLLGYAYNLYDPFISKQIHRQLSSLGVGVATWEMLDPALIERQLANLKRPLFWNFGKMVLGAGLHFLDDPRVDGVIYVTTFGCGPDSVATNILSLEAAVKQKPLLHLNLDEHTEPGHLTTRLEAFVDMLVTLKEESVV